MPIVGLNFDKIGAKKDNKITGKVQIKNNVDIRSIEQEKLSVSSSDDILRINFEFKSTYEPGVGAIQLNGHVLYMDDPKKIDEIAKEWKKSKSLQKDISPLIINAVLARCNIKALVLSQDVSLPPHVRLPTLKTN